MIRKFANSSSFAFYSFRFGPSTSNISGFGGYNCSGTENSIQRYITSAVVLKLLHFPPAGLNTTTTIIYSHADLATVFGATLGGGIVLLNAIAVLLAITVLPVVGLCYCYRKKRS